MSKPTIERYKDLGISTGEQQSSVSEAGERLNAVTVALVDLMAAEHIVLSAVTDFDLQTDFRARFARARSLMWSEGETHPVASGRATIPSEADERPELTVWYGPMPESNGKSNFTAVLMRKDTGWDGPHVTIERGEYPDRIRYEADRVRHLIGDLSEKPDILAYDANKHSGYMKPDCAAAPDIATTAADQQGDTASASGALDVDTMWEIHGVVKNAGSTRLAHKIADAIAQQGAAQAQAQDGVA